MYLFKRIALTATILVCQAQHYSYIGCYAVDGHIETLGSPRTETAFSLSLRWYGRPKLLSCRRHKSNLDKEGDDDCTSCSPLLGGREDEACGSFEAVSLYPALADRISGFVCPCNRSINFRPATSSIVPHPVSSSAVPAPGK